MIAAVGHHGGKVGSRLTQNAVLEGNFRSVGPLVVVKLERVAKARHFVGKSTYVVDSVAKLRGVLIEVVDQGVDGHHDQFCAAVSYQTSSHVEGDRWCVSDTAGRGLGNGLFPR